MLQSKTLTELFSGHFAELHAQSAIRHFGRMVEDFQKGDWEDSVAKGGKFVEAVLKCLWVHVGETVPEGRDFAVGTIIDRLPGKTTFADTIRLTIPRGCRFVYDIASNRAARHDKTEIDSSEMDSSVVLSVCSWTLSEMVRYSQSGLDLAGAKRIVDGLMRKRFPLFEDIDGRIYTEAGKSASDVALLILARTYPGRMTRADLIASVVRHGHKSTNAGMAVTRLFSEVDYDSEGRLCLRNRGLRKAEQLLQNARLQNPESSADLSIQP